MKPQNVQIILVIIGILVISGLIYHSNFRNPLISMEIRDLESTTTTTIKTDPFPAINNLSSSDWETYTDEKYGFSYKQPAKGSSYSGYNKFRVDPVPESRTKTTLDVYANEIWNKNATDPNPNFPNRFLSSLKLTTLNSRPAYTFDVDGFFTSDLNSYVLEAKSTYIITANQNGQKFIIHFPTNDGISKVILSTLLIDASLIAPKESPADWQTYKNDVYGFELSYPKNIFLERLDPYRNSIFSVRGKRGAINLRILNTKLDPNNISDIYGRIENPAAVRVGNRIGYEFGFGDAGCGATLIDVEVATDNTLRISFGSCEGDLYPIVSDKELQAQILSTFKFTK